MTQSRMVLFNLLETKFKDQSLKQATLKKIQQYWEKTAPDGSLITRAFDPLQFISLMPMTRFKLFLDDFMALLNLDVLDKSSDGKLLLDASAQLHIKKWAVRVIEYACENLLDESGALNNKLIRLLRWHEFAADYIYAPSQVDSIVRALSGTLYQQLTFNQSTKPYLSSDVYLAVIAFINKNYGSWASAALKSAYTFPNDHSAKLEVKAAVNVNKWLSKMDLPISELEEFYIQLCHQEKMDRSSCYAFWLEAMMQSVAHEKLFTSLWIVFSHHIEPIRDVPHLTELQKDQYHICEKRFASLKMKPAFSTNFLLEKLSSVTESKEIKPNAAIEMISAKASFEADLPEVDGYFLVPNDMHAPLSQSSPSFFGQVASDLSDQVFDLVSTIKMKFSA